MFAGDQATQFRQAVHRRAGGDHQRRFRIAHRVGNQRQRVDVIDRVFGETAVNVLPNHSVPYAVILMPSFAVATSSATDNVMD